MKLWNVTVGFNAVVLAESEEHAKMVLFHDVRHALSRTADRCIEDIEEITSVYNLPLDWAEVEPCVGPYIGDGKDRMWRTLGGKLMKCADIVGREYIDGRQSLPTPEREYLTKAADALPKEGTDHE